MDNNLRQFYSRNRSKEPMFNGDQMHGETVTRHAEKKRCFRSCLRILICLTIAVFITFLSACIEKTTTSSEKTDSVVHSIFYQTGSYDSSHVWYPNYVVAKRKGEIRSDVPERRSFSFDSAEYTGKYYRTYGQSDLFGEYDYYTGRWGYMEYKQDTDVLVGLYLTYFPNDHQTPNDDESGTIRDEARRRALEIAGAYIDVGRYVLSETEIIRSWTGLTQIAYEPMYTFTFRKQIGEYGTNDQLNVYFLPDGTLIGVRMLDFGRYDDLDPGAIVFDEDRLKTSIEDFLLETQSKYGFNADEYSVTDRYLAATSDGKLLMISQIEWNSGNLALGSVAVVATEI